MLALVERLDPFTLILASVVASLPVVLSTILVAALASELRGPRYLMFGLGSVVAGIVTHLLGGFGVLSSILADLLMIVGLMGIREAARAASPRAMWERVPDAVVLGAAFLGLLWFNTVDPLASGRTAVASGAMAVTCLAISLELGLRPGPLTLRLSGIVGFFITGAALGARASWWLDHPTVEAIDVATGPATRLPLLASLFGMTLGTSGSLVMTAHELVSELRATRSRLEDQALRDGLTGLFNRKALFDRAQAAVTFARRHHHSLAVVLFDLDRFKALNDTLGHAAGDAALVETARRCREALRNEDLLGRIGGEEFVAILPATGTEGALILAERLRVALSREPLLLAGVQHHLTASIGVAVISAEDADAAGLIARADKAMYVAKRRGGDSVELSGARGPLFSP